jgi:uncharacterized protein
MKDHMLAALDALARADSAPFLALFDDDIVWTISGTTPWSRTFTGRADVLAIFRALAARIDGPYRMRAHRVIADGEHVVVEGRGDNLLRTGQRYDNTYCWVCRFRGDRLVELVEYMDTALVERVFGGAAQQPTPG